MRSLKWAGIVVGIITLLLSTPVVAGQATDTLGQEWESIFEAYGLRDVTELPPGVTPVKVDTPEQLQRLLRAVTQRLANRETHFIIQGKLRSPSSQGVSMLPQEVSMLTVSETYVPLHRKILIDPICRVYFNLWADVWVAGSGSFWEITDVHEWVGLTGFTMWWDLSNESTYHRIASDRQSVFIKGSAIANQYILIRGLLKVYSFPVSLSITYQIS